MKKLLLILLAFLVASVLFTGVAFADESVSLSISSCPTTLSVGSSVDVYAYLCDENGTILENEDVVWGVVSGDSVEVIADSSSHGIVTAVSSGVSVISASSRNYPTLVQMVEITVPKIEDVETSVFSNVDVMTVGADAEMVAASGESIPTSISSSSYSYLSFTEWDTQANTTLGRSPHLDIYIHDQYGNILSSEGVVWTVDNESVLTIRTASYNPHIGEITLKNTGTAVITATSMSNSSLSKSTTITVEEPIATSVSLSKPSGVTLGSSPYLMAYIYDQYGWMMYSDDKLSLSVSDTSILTIAKSQITSGDGTTITPKAIGSTTIHVEVVNNPAITNDVEITVSDPVLTSIETNGYSGLSFSSGNTIKTTLGLKPTISFRVADQFGNLLSSEAVVVSVADESILTVSPTETTSSTTFTLKKTGTTHFTVSSKTDPSISEPYTITVEAPVITSIDLWGLSGLSLGTSDTVWASVNDQFGNSLSSEGIIWSVSDTSVLSLSETNSGRTATVTPVSLGTATIYAKSKSKPSVIKELTIVVEEPIVTSLYMNPLSGVSVGYETDMYASVQDQFGNTITSENILWSVDKPDSLRLSSSETKSGSSVSVTGVSAGVVTITATAKSNSKLTKTSTISVETPIISSINVWYPSITMSLGSTESVWGYVQDQFRNTLDSENILWSVKDSSILAFSTTETRPGQSTTIKPKAEGSTIIYAKSKTNPSIVAEIPITIEKTVISEFTVICNDGVSLGSTSDAYVQIRDQFYDYVTSETILWSVDDPSIIRLSASETLSQERITITPLEKGSTMIHVTVKDNPSFTQSIRFSVEDPVIMSVDIQSPTVMSHGSKDTL